MIEKFKGGQKFIYVTIPMQANHRAMNFWCDFLKTLDMEITFLDFLDESGKVERVINQIKFISEALCSPDKIRSISLSLASFYRSLEKMVLHIPAR